MGIQISFAADDEDEIIELVKSWLEKRGAGPEEPSEEETTEEESSEEESGEEEGTELLGEDQQEEADPMQVLRDKIVDKIRVMSKKPPDVLKIREAFKKVKIAKFDDDVKDSKLTPLAKLLGIKV